MKKSCALQKKSDIMKHILLVEDDVFLSDMYSTKLKEAGYSVAISRSGKDAIEKIQDKPLDLVLLDIVLPHKDGWAVLKKIRENDELKDVKVILLSNLGQKSEVQKGIDLGAEKYFIKAHYTPKQVVEEVQKLLK